MTNGAIETVLWPGAKAIIGADLRNSGIFANKSGYHNSRNNLKRTRPSDYSIQLAVDKEGPGDLGSAIDLSFDSARLHGDYHNIAKWSQVLLNAGQRKDPRAYPLREFQGNIDLDRDVEGWSFYRGHALTSSDKTHLWHIHLSIYRKYINDEAAMRSILSILKGEDPVAYPIPKTNDVYLSKLVLGQTDSDSVWQLQTALNKLGSSFTLNGDYGKTVAEHVAKAIFKAAGMAVTVHNDL